MNKSESKKVLRPTGVDPDEFPFELAVDGKKVTLWAKESHGVFSPDAETFRRAIEEVKEEVRALRKRGYEIFGVESSLLQ